MSDELPEALARAEARAKAAEARILELEAKTLRQQEALRECGLALAQQTQKVAALEEVLTAALSRHGVDAP